VSKMLNKLKEADTKRSDTVRAKSSILSKNIRKPISKDDANSFRRKNVIL